MSDFAGFAKLRPGRIHIYCPACKRKMSNVPRNAGYSYPDDPPKAVLAHVYCLRCSEGCKDVPVTYLNARGRELCSYCGERCELVGTRKRCSERLINECVARGAASRAAAR